MNALIVLVFYAIAVAVFFFGCIVERGRPPVVPVDWQLPLVLLLITYGLVMATWSAIRSRKVDPEADFKALEKNLDALKESFKSLSSSVERRT